MQNFKNPKEALGDLDPEGRAALIAAAADVTLIVDDGVIRDLAFGSDELALAWSGQWLGRPWVNTVTVESRPKVEALLREAATPTTGPRWRHVNHPSAGGPDIPVLYNVLRVGRRRGRVVAVGRDLRATAALQQRLVDVQLSMERDYSRLRHAETRYRLLFQSTAEAVLIVEAQSRKVVEANPAADRLLGPSTRRGAERSFPEGLDPAGTAAIDAILSEVRATGRADEVRARSRDGSRELKIAVSLFRQESSAYFLVRLSALGAEAAAAAAAALPGIKARLLKLVEGAPDGFVVTGQDGRILTANAAFLDLAQLVNEHQAIGESLERWLGRPGVDLDVLIANLRQHGSVRLFATTLRGEYGATAEIEVSAASLADGGQPCLGFAIRDVGRRLTTDRRQHRELPHSIEQLTELVGRVPLKDLVRETTDVIERLCIEAALELTGDNRASAAEILGLSRQSLYVKLRRYGLGDLVPEGEA